MDFSGFAEAIKSVVEAVKDLLQELAKNFSDLVASLTQGTVYEFEYGQARGRVVSTIDRSVTQYTKRSSPIPERPTHQRVQQW